MRRAGALSFEHLEKRCVLSVTTVFAVNAGGPALTGTPNWAADTSTVPSARSNATAALSQTYAVTNAIDLTHASVPAGTPMALFQTERYDPDDGVEMQWDFAVTPGQYEVRLYFAEIYSGAQSVGARVFDVAIEGTTVLNDYDVFAEVGGYKGVVKTFQVTSNANLDIDFSHVEENPAVKAIQILSVTPDANQLSVSPSSLSFGSKALGSTTTQSVTLTNTGGVGAPSIVIDATNLTGTNANQFTDGFNDAADVTLAPGASTTIAVNFVPTSNGAKSASVSIVHSGSNSPITVPLTGTGGTTTIPIGFGKTSLVGENLKDPTSLQFGPDGRLYVSEQEGLIKIYSVKRNAANNYSVTATETITSIQSIPNHNDNGALNTTENTRLVTGLFVTGTAANPVLYVTSSDPRIGAGPDGEDLNLDTNSGILSRLTWNGSTWVKLDLVRGLPRSEENHASNGMALDKVNNILYIGQGGHTNMGAPSANFALLPEYALSAAVLSINLSAIGNATYDLPTLDDETRAGTTDANDPFGGNDGKNQAKLVPSGPVQVYSSGFRNPYDVLLTQAGKLYSIDNGPNGGWGDVPVTASGSPTTAATAGSATNSVHEPGDSLPDNLHLLSAGYYAGHPNPTRANLANTFNPTNPQSPVSTANPVEGAYRAPGAENGALALFDNSTNGLTEYTASNFGGAMKGDILAASFSDQIFRMKLNAAGNAVALQQALFNNVGTSPLDVTAQGDSGPFPGTIWVADYEGNSIVVFEPNDFDPNGTGGTGADDPALDEDGDGYNNHDEIANGTNPLSAGDVPPDWDHDFSSNLLDGDDDNDTKSDTSDPFAIDPSNGKSLHLPVQYTWENEGPHSGGLLNMGFTGLMTNGSANYESLFDKNKMTAGGAAGVLTVDAVSEGDATGAANTQEYAFQFGVDVQSGTGPFTARTRIVGPFAGLTPQAGQSMGLFIGNGDQDNYFKLVVSGASGGGVQWVKEVGGVVTTGDFDAIALPGPSAIDLYLTVDPSAATVQARYTVTSGGVTGARINLGTPIAIPSTWWTGSTGLAVGIISSSAGPAPTFPATWDFLLVTPETTQILQASPGSLDFGNVTSGTTATRTLTLTNTGVAGDPSIVIDATTISGTDAAQFSDAFNDAADVTLAPGASTTINVTFTPSATGSRTANLSIAHSGTNTPLIVPLAGMAEQASTGNALVEVTPGLDPDINASTYGDNSFQITNNSGGSTKIASVRFDLSGSLLPDVVFDPEGTAGDFTSKDFTPDSASAVGLAGHTFLIPKAGGGYSALDIQFTDFGPGEFFDFSVDIDPTSIKGADAPGPNESGSVSGLEMTGATVIVTFSDGSVQTTNLFREAGSLNGGRAILKTGVPPKPTIQLLDTTPPVTLSNASQTVRVSGPVGATVALLQVEAGLFTTGVPGGGFDIDPYEANSVIAVAEYGATIGSAGYVDIPITLTKSQSSAGLNHLVATIKDAGGRSGPTSAVLVVQFSPGSQPPQNHAPVVSAGADQIVTLPGTASLQGAVTDDGLPAGSTPTISWSKFSGPGTVNFANPASAATSASFSAAGTYVLRLTASDGQLSSSDDLTITVNTASTIAVVSLTLINADTDLPIAGIDPLISGTTLNLATLPTRNINVRANVSTGSIGSVRFALDANANYNTENVAPYSIGGDSNGNFNPWIPAIGAHTLRATPYSGANAGGSAGTPLTITFTVIDNAAIVLGDHNQNGLVDAADYVLWRKTSINGQQGYDAWRTHFGQTTGQGAGSADQAEVSVSSGSEPTDSDPLGLGSYQAAETTDEFLVSAVPGNNGLRSALSSETPIQPARLDQLRIAGTTDDLLVSEEPGSYGPPSILSSATLTQPARSGQLWIAGRRGSRIEDLKSTLEILAINKPSFHDEALLSWSSDGDRELESTTTDEAGLDASSHDVTSAEFDAFDQALSAMVSAGLR